MSPAPLHHDSGDAPSPVGARPEGYDDALTAVLAVLAPLAHRKRVAVAPTTSLLTELDLDSLEMLEFVDAVKEQCGVDLTALPIPLSSLPTPAAVAVAIAQSPPSRIAAPSGSSP